MKNYIKNQIIMYIEIVILSVFVFVLKEAPQSSSFLLAVNNDIGNKNVDVKVIQASQTELYKEGLYNPIYTFQGELTGYGGDCPVCSGRVACPPRMNVNKEGIYYDDKTYGTVRIVASSRKYPCGTILRFNVKKLSKEPIIAIILDRGVGGNVIDLLTESEAWANDNVGRVKNLKFEVLREGWKR